MVTYSQLNVHHFQFLGMLKTNKWTEIVILQWNFTIEFK